MAEIKNREDLERWLDNRQREDAVVIAARAALRVAPLLVTALDKNAEERRTTVILPSLRAIAASWVAAVGSTHGVEVRNAAAASAYANNGTIAIVKDYANAAYSAAAYAAAYAAYIANSAVAAVSAVAYAAAYVSNAVADADTIWLAVCADATALELGQLPENVATNPLWPQDPPDWAAAAWAELKDHLLNTGGGWEVWTNWYEDRLRGRPFNKALEEARVLIPDEIWQLGPKVANAEIALLIEEHSPSRNRVDDLERENQALKTVIGPMRTTIEELKSMVETAKKRDADILRNAQLTYYELEALEPIGEEVFVPVHYATNRNLTGGTEPNDFYGSDRGDLCYGLAHVSIPKNTQLVD